MGFFLSKINPLTTMEKNGQKSYTLTCGYTADSPIRPKTLCCSFMEYYMRALKFVSVNHTGDEMKQWVGAVLETRYLTSVSSTYTTHTHSLPPTVVSLCLRWLICLCAAVYMKYKRERETVCKKKRMTDSVKTPSWSWGGKRSSKTG